MRHIFRHQLFWQQTGMNEKIEITLNKPAIMIGQSWLLNNSVSQSLCVHSHGSIHSVNCCHCHEVWTELFLALTSFPLNLWGRNCHLFFNNYLTFHWYALAYSSFCNKLFLSLYYIVLPGSIFSLISITITLCMLNYVLKYMWIKTGWYTCEEIATQQWQ